jgi:PAS domain S-box-containing protein
MGPILGAVSYRVASRYDKHKIATHSLERSGQPAEAAPRQSNSVRPFWLGVAVLAAWETLCGIVIASSKLLRDTAVKDHDRILRSICTSMNDGVVVADKNDKFLLFNKAAEDMIGLGPMDVPQADWSAAYGCYLPDRETPFPADQLPLSRAVKGERVSDVEIFIRHPKKPHGVWLNVNGAPLLDEKGAVTGGVVILRDVTDRKAAEDINRRLSNAFEQTDDTVFITDRHGTIEYVNAAFEATTGYTRKEALGQTPRILKSGNHDVDYYKSLWATILAGNVHRGITVNRKKNGELYYAEQTITPMKDASGRITHFVSVVKDMTERRKKEQLEIEMQLAALVQKKLYPQASPEIPGLDIAGSVFPVRAVCGDYFDYIKMPNDRLGIAIGDVKGHGFGPALIMAQTRAYLRSLVQTHSDLGDVLTALSQSLAADLDDDNFVTLLVASIDIRTRQLTYVNAGHTSGYVLDRSGALKAELASTGLPLNVSPERGHSIGPRISLEAGDLMVLITDGITESRRRDGEQLDPHGALEVIRTHRHKPVGEIVDSIHKAGREFAGGLPQDDDITIVVCRVEA